MTMLRIYGRDDETVDIETIDWTRYAADINAAWSLANEEGDGFAPSDDEDAAIGSFGYGDGSGSLDALGYLQAILDTGAGRGTLALYLDNAGNLFAVCDSNGPWAQNVGSLR